MENLVREHQTRVFRYLLLVTRSREDAEDLSQETWLRVIERGSQYRGDCAFGSWLLAVARNLAIDTAREARRWQATPVDEIDSRPGILSSNVPLPQEVACKRELASRLRDAVRQLPPRLQIVCRLRLEEGLRLRDIAARLGMPLGTVRSRLHRGVAAVRARLGE